MTRPTQEQLDEFARRLRALEAELAQLRREAQTVPAPAPAAPTPPVAAPPPRPEPAVRPRVAGSLQHASDLLAAGQLRPAVKELERGRKRALAAMSADELEQILELARTAAARGAAAAPRLVYTLEQDLRFTQRTPARPAQWPPPACAA